MGAEASGMHAPQPLPHNGKVIAVSTVAGKESWRYSSTRSMESDYRIETKVVGSGQSGPVKLATAINGGQKCAVKSFNKKGISARRLSELKSEAEIYLSLDHPHVARLQMVYETAQEAHFVMEYMEGGELYSRLATKKQYTEAAAAEASNQMLTAVAYLHARGIAHRDLKLENLLYERKETSILKVIDFGLAKFYDRDTKMSQACGSVHYVAPEVLAHAYTEKADIWSMGVIIFMLLTGSPPFFGTDDEVFQKIKSAEVCWSSRFRKLSDSAKDFLRALFTPDPTFRPSAQEALDHPWLHSHSHLEEASVDVSFMSNLRSFAHASQVKRKILHMMAWMTPMEESPRLRKQFLAFDRSSSGTIKLQDFKTALEGQLKVGDSKADYLFSCIDMNSNGEIEYHEFLAAVQFVQATVDDDMLRKAFARFNSNGSDTIDHEELANLIGEPASSFELEELVQDKNTPGNGDVNREEFLMQFCKPLAESDFRKEKRRKTETLGIIIDSAMSADGADVMCGSMSATPIARWRALVSPLAGVLYRAFSPCASGCATGHILPSK